ncbi:carbohydrate ABC transporter permease [Leucobacter aridicollis]|uniref:ABC-type glycerol-3-phosphate transport system permease component n=1 Tax=Leucobacter aridicollis TaxID=283878 RepID=A0A852R926_9MICO|nr:carbohydrate ABC transporter permease [Leucobacter aridicollis]MBL3683172.1 carbohydrate ABC transporter permease [Leucobacter aridicollis]NYD25400.1 ABC-type glycerol-3-phosphate transport system permease component [Leucobacter aridicollis]
MTETTTLLIAEAEERRGRKNARLRRSAQRPRAGRAGIAIRTVIAAVVALIVVFPLYWMIVVAFSPRGEVFEPGLRFWPSTFTLENFAKVFDRFPVMEWFGNSLVIGTFVTAITVVVNLLAGYAFARLRFRGSNVVFLLALATMMIPVQAIMVAQFKLVSGLGIYGSYWGVIFPAAATAFGVFLARQFFLGIPDEVIEAARIDGAGQIRIFVQVVLPLCKPLVAVLTLLTLMGSWNDFAWPLIALKDNELFTLPIGLLFLKNQTAPDYNAIMALALISVLPMVLLFIFFQRYFVQGFARSGIK